LDAEFSKGVSLGFNIFPATSEGRREILAMFLLRAIEERDS